jgi:hypothetical protein
MPNGASRTRGLHKKDANSSSNKLHERLETSLGTYCKGFEAAPLLDLERDAPAEYHDRLTRAAESLIVSARCGFAETPKHSFSVLHPTGAVWEDRLPGALAKRARPGLRQRLAEGRR